MAINVKTLRWVEDLNNYLLCFCSSCYPERRGFGLPWNLGFPFFGIQKVIYELILDPKILAVNSAATSLSQIR